MSGKVPGEVSGEVSCGCLGRCQGMCLGRSQETPGGARHQEATGGARRPQAAKTDTPMSENLLLVEAKCPVSPRNDFRVAKNVKHSSKSRGSA